MLHIFRLCLGSWLQSTCTILLICFYHAFNLFPVCIKKCCFSDWNNTLSYCVKGFVTNFFSPMAESEKSFVDEMNSNNTAVMIHLCYWWCIYIRLVPEMVAGDGVARAWPARRRDPNESAGCDDERLLLGIRQEQRWLPARRGVQRTPSAANEAWSSEGKVQAREETLGWVVKRTCVIVL